MKEIPLGQGKTAKVDDADYKELMKFKWHAVKHGKTFYAARPGDIEKGEPLLVYMHDQIMGIKR